MTNANLQLTKATKSAFLCNLKNVSNFALEKPTSYKLKTTVHYEELCNQEPQWLAERRR